MSEADGIVYIEGSVPVLVVAPHVGVLREHFTEDIYAYARDTEVGTDDIATTIKEYIGVHVLINKNDMIDPNNACYRDSAFRHKIRQVIKENDIKLVVDLHGMADIGIIHLKPHEESSASGPALSYADTRYERRIAQRPDVDLEFRRRARVSSTTCSGVVVELFKNAILNMGFSVGIEAVYPGGDIIAECRSVSTQAISIESAKRIRSDTSNLPLLAKAITRAIFGFLGMELTADLAIPDTLVPQLEMLGEPIEDPDPTRTMVS